MKHLASRIDVRDIAKRLPRWLRREPTILGRICQLGVRVPPSLLWAVNDAGYVEKYMGGREAVIDYLRCCRKQPDWNDAFMFVITIAGFDRMELPGVPFPPPPFKDTPRLTALSSKRLLDREGREMANCCGSMAVSVRLDQRWFYRWADTERATVGLKRGENGYWELFAAKTQANGRPKLETRQSIVDELRAVLGDDFKHRRMARVRPRTEFKWVKGQNGHWVEVVAKDALELTASTTARPRPSHRRK